MSRQRSGQVWHDWSKLYGATLAGQAISGVRTLVVAGLLGPQQFGLWKSLQLVLSYSTWSDLGALRGLGRQVPLLRGEGRLAEAERVQRTAWTQLLGLTAAVTLALLAAGAWSSDSVLGSGLLFVAPVVLSTRVLFFFFELTNAQRAFGLKSRAVSILAVTDGLLAPLASWVGGVWLFMCSITATNVVVIGYLAVKLSFPWRLSWRLSDMTALSLVGFPIVIAGFVFELLRTVDRFVIVTFLGTEAVGYYGLAMIVFEMAVTVPVLFGQVMLPHMAEQFGRQGESTRLFDEAERVIVTVNRFLPFLLAVGWLILPSATRVLLPAYAPGTPAARILLWAPVFVTVPSIVSVVLITLRRCDVLILLHGAALVVAGLLCFGAVTAGFGVTGVAAAMVIAYGASAVSTFLVAGHLCRRGVTPLLRKLARVYQPVIIALAGAIVMEHGILTLPALARAGAAVVGLAALGATAMWCKYRWRCATAPAASAAVDRGSSDREPLVSVVLPVRNGADCIAAAVGSILGQTYTSIELMVVDDCSDDATPDILAGISNPRLRVVRLERNIGVTAARNAGIRASTGVFVAAMDADDLSHPERIARQVEFLHRHPDYVMVSCAFDCVDSAGRVLDRVCPPARDEAIRRLLVRANPFAHSAVMLRRDALEGVGLYDEAMRYAEDYDLYFRLAHRGKLGTLPEVLHQIRVHSESQTQQLENRICYYDVLARARAIARGQYPWRDFRHLLPTAVSMLVPLRVKRWRRSRWHASYSYYRRPAVEVRPTADSPGPSELPTLNGKDCAG